MSESEYIEPRSLKETLLLLSEFKNTARLIAGGTDLITKMKRGEEIPSVLINIRQLQDLNYINDDTKYGLRVGALTPIAAIEKSQLIQNKFPLLSETAHMMASPGIRAQATIGGNLCNAAPSADMAPALLVLGAKLKLSSLNGDRVVPLENFFVGPGTTILKSGEVLSEIQIPEMPHRSGTAYMKHTRRKGADLAIVGVAVLVTPDTSIFERTGSDTANLLDMSIKDIRIALGAVAPTPLRALDAENTLKGKKITEEISVKAIHAVVAICKPISDVRSSAEYRLKLVEVLLPRAIKQALEQAHRRINDEG